MSMRIFKNARKCINITFTVKMFNMVCEKRIYNLKIVLLNAHKQEKNIEVFYFEI